MYGGNNRQVLRQEVRIKSGGTEIRPGETSRRVREVSLAQRRGVYVWTIRLRGGGDVEIGASFIIWRRFALSLRQRDHKNKTVGVERIMLVPSSPF